MQRHVGGARAMHAHHAQVIRRRRNHRSQPMHSGKRRNVQEVEKLPQFRNRPRKFRARADQRHRFLGLLQQGDQRIAKCRFSLRVRRPCFGGKLHRSGKFHFRFEKIRRDIDHHRPRTSFAGPIKSFRNRRWNFFDGLHQPAPLGQRERQPEYVGFLEGIRADQSAANLPGDADQRHRIHFRVSDSGHEIRGARPAGGNRNADLPRGARMAFGGKHRALLVPRENVADAAALERVIQRHDRAAGVAEHQFHALGAQALQKDFRSSKH